MKKKYKKGDYLEVIGGDISDYIGYSGICGGYKKGSVVLIRPNGFVLIFREEELKKIG